MNSNEIQSKHTQMLIEMKIRETELNHIIIAMSSALVLRYG